MYSTTIGRQDCMWHNNTRIISQYLYKFVAPCIMCSGALSSHTKLVGFSSFSVLSQMVWYYTLIVGILRIELMPDVLYSIINLDNGIVFVLGDGPNLFDCSKTMYII